MVEGYEALANTQLSDFYKMLKILKLTPIGFAALYPTDIYIWNLLLNSRSILLSMWVFSNRQSIYNRIVW